VLKVNIGYVLNIFPALSESFILNEITALIDMGHNITIFSILPPKEKLTHKEYEKYELLNKTYYFLNEKNINNIFRLIKNSWGVFGSENKSLTLTERGSIPASKYFIKIIRDNGLKIDLLHAHFNSTSTQTAMYMASKLKLPFTFTIHARDLFWKSNVFLLKKRVEQSSGVITVSHYNTEILKNANCLDAKKTFVVRACPKLMQPNSISQKRDNFTILTVGRLVDKKGVKYAILAVNRLIERFPIIQYKIIGSGPLKNELTNLISSLNLEKNVTLLGSCDDNTLIKELEKATVFVLPCVKGADGDMDGIPVSLMEAMYVGTPVISTNISGIPELIKNNQDGFLVDPKDSVMLSDAIGTLMDDKILQTKFGQVGRLKIQNEFNQKTEAIKLASIWQRILSSDKAN
jgi:colanic acid/amylovoran biosynthesis glycosyltransferase